MTNSPSGVAGASPLTAILDRPYLLLTLTTLFWGGNVVAGKLAIGHIDPHVLMLARWTGALLIVLPFAIAPLKRDWPQIRRRWWLLLIYGALGYASFNVFVYLAAYLTSGVNIAIEQVAINIFVMALNFALFRTRVRGLQLAGVLITILGIALTATHGDLSRILALDVGLGDLMMIIASFAYALYSLSLRWRPATSWPSFLVVSFLGAILASFAYQAGLGQGPAALPALIAETTWQGWVIALYTALLPSVISQFFYVRGVELIGANRASLFINLVPLFGAVGSVIVLGERLETFHLIAGALVILGIVLAEWSARRA